MLTKMGSQNIYKQLFNFFSSPCSLPFSSLPCHYMAVWFALSFGTLTHFCCLRKWEYTVVSTLQRTKAICKRYFLQINESACWRRKSNFEIVMSWIYKKASVGRKEDSWWDEHKECFVKMVISMYFKRQKHFFGCNVMTYAYYVPRDVRGEYSSQMSLFLLEISFHMEIGINFNLFVWQHWQHWPQMKRNYTNVPKS